MAKLDILDYLENALANNLPNQYDVEIDWDSKKHQILIVFCIYADNKNHVELVDVDGNISEEIITFEDCILLNGGKSDVDENDYLKVLAFDRKKGISKHNLDNFVQAFFKMLDDGQMDLLDFLETADKDIFELTFDFSFADDQTNMISYPKF